MIVAVVALGIGATALAFAVDTGPTPPARPLASAVHDALSAPAPQGFSANVQYTNHLLEGADLAEGAGGGSGGGEGLASSPLLAGGSGRIWVSGDRFRLELQSERGDTELVYDGHTLTLYDAAQDTVYRYTPPRPGHGEGAGGSSPTTDRPPRSDARSVPSPAKIEEAIARLRRHAVLSEATPTDVAGQAAYTVSLAPKEPGSLLSNVQLSFDAQNAVPLRAAVYATDSSSPVVELAASEVSFGPVESSVFTLDVPAGAKVHTVKTPEGRGASRRSRRRGAPRGGQAAHLTMHGHGPGAIAVLEAKASGKGEGSSATEGLPQVSVDGTKAAELRTALGTVLSFERAGVRYVLAGSVEPGALLTLASGL